MTKLFFKELFSTLKTWNSLTLDKFHTWVLYKLPPPHSTSFYVIGGSALTFWYWPGCRTAEIYRRIFQVLVLTKNTLQNINKSLCLLWQNISLYQVVFRQEWKQWINLLLLLIEIWKDGGFSIEIISPSDLKLLCMSFLKWCLHR